jgi:hypothetical protein
MLLLLGIFLRRLHNKSPVHLLHMMMKMVIIPAAALPMQIASVSIAA